MNFPTVYVCNSTRSEAFLPQAQALLDTLETSDINTIIENMSAIEPDHAIAMLALHEGTTIREAIVKHVDSRGQVSRTKDLRTRQRQATQTTGLSKAKRREIARRAVKTKKSNPSIGTRALKKRKKALKKRAALGM